MRPTALKMEMSRLPRTGRDSHQLLELYSLSGVLLAEPVARADDRRVRRELQLQRGQSRRLPAAHGIRTGNLPDQAARRIFTYEIRFTYDIRRPA
jgi:hypothetical protein